MALNTAGRAEVLRFGGVIRSDTMTEATIESEERFVVTTGGGQRISCRQILVASGVRDEMPNIPGVRALWGDRVVICPYCDGWEVRGSSIAILGTGTKSIFQAQLVRQWSDRVVLYTNGSVSPSVDEYEKLERRGIRVVDGSVGELRRSGRRVDLLVGDRSFSHDIVFTAPRPIPDNRILDALHADMTVTAAGTLPLVDARGATSVPGLWAAGNAVNPSLKYSTAMGAGMDTATHINEALVEADIVRAAAD